MPVTVGGYIHAAQRNDAMCQELILTHRKLA
jgi:hypothetical protein